MSGSSKFVNWGEYRFLQNWRSLYANQTKAEAALEPKIAALGYRYRTQHPWFGLGIISDFLLPDINLVIEVDGASHLRAAQKETDLRHALALKRRGYDVVRISNDAVFRDPEQALQAALSTPPQDLAELEAAVAQLPSPSGSGAKPRKQKSAPQVKTAPVGE